MSSKSLNVGLSNESIKALNLSVLLLLFSCSVMSDCDLMDYSPPDSSVHGVPQAMILEWVAMPYSRGSSQPRGRTCISYIAGGFFTI